jgi:RHS repeat-associated protein
MFAHWIAKLARAFENDRRPTPRPTRALGLQPLEERRLLSIQPLDLADPSLYGASGTFPSSHPSISADGQLVAFLSGANDLVPNDTSYLLNDYLGGPDAFVFNRATGTVTLVSAGPTGQAGGVVNGTFPVISPDGRYVAFESAGDFNGGTILSGVNGDQLYVRDLQTGVTTLASVAADGSTAGNGMSYSPEFSADSNQLGFLSRSTNLVSGIAFTQSANLFERNLATHTTVLVSVAMNGAADSGVDVPQFPVPFSLSADGRFVAFQSSATNVAPHDVNGNQNVYVRDMVAGTSTLVDTDLTGTSNGDGHNVIAPDTQALSADGRYVIFESNADNLVRVNSFRTEQVYLRDRVAGTTTLVSAMPDGAAAGGVGESISPDGQWVAFVSAAALIAQDTNGQVDVYLYNTATGALSLASLNQAGTNGGNNTSGSTNYPYDFSVGGLVFSADSRQLAFQSSATDLTAGVATSHRNLYERDLVAATTQLLTANAAGSDGGDGDSHAPALSADGRYVAFESSADNLVAADNNRRQDVFVRDTAAGATALASRHSPLLPNAYLPTFGAALGDITPDGRYVAFTSVSLASGQFGYANDLAPTVNFTQSQSVFVRDRQTGLLTVVDMTADGTAADGGFAPQITPDGRHVVFLSQSQKLVNGLSYSGYDAVYERDLQTGKTTIVSVNPAGNHDVDVGYAGEIAVSDDGRYVAYTSYDPSGVAGASDANDTYVAVYLRDVQTGVTYLVSHDLANDGQIRGNSTKISISADGRYVLFASDDPNLAAGDNNNAGDVFRWDRTTGGAALVSINAAGAGPGNAISAHDRAVMTPDGRYVAFDSGASDLVAGDANGNDDVFVRDMTADTTTLVSVNQFGTGSGDNGSDFPSISDDGTRVAFVSSASDLVPGHAGSFQGDVYVRDLAAKATTLVSVNAAGTGAGNGSSYPDYNGGGAPRISSDGRYVVFISFATDLVPNFVDGNGPDGNDLFVRDLTTGKTMLLSVNDSGTASGDHSPYYNYLVNLFSAASKTVFFDSSSDNLVAGDRNGSTDVFAYPILGTSTISGQVFGDANADGANDNGEQGLPYWTVYLDANGNGQLDTGEQSVVTDASGHYRFTDLAPGTYTVTIVPHTGYQQTLPAANASYTVTLAADGDAATGKDFGEVLPLPDLAVQSVSLPSSGGVGQPISVSWTVANQGAGAANGSWQDALYLSTKPTLDAGAVLLDDVAHNGGLAKGAIYTGADTVDVPALPSGNYYLIVDIDRRDQVFEGDLHANKANNIAHSTGTMAVALPSIALGAPQHDQFTAAGQDHYYQVTVSAGQTLLVSLASAATSGEIDLYVRRGDYPTPSDFDFASRTPADPNPSLSLPNLQAGTYYLLVRGDYGSAATAAFTLTASAATFDVQSISPAIGGNTGNVTVAIDATLLSNHTQASLISGQTVVPAVSLFYQGGSMLYATFDLTGKPTGAYDLKLDDGTQTKTDAGAFTVVAGDTGGTQIALSAPRLVRANSNSAAPHLPTASGVIISYTNTGNTDAPAPLLMLSADAALLRLPEQPSFDGNSVQFLGTSGDGPAGIVRPGESGQIIIPFQPTDSVPVDGVGPGINFNVQIADTTQPFDLSPFKDSMRPDGIGADAWNAVFANLSAALGTTVASYQQALDNDATYLSLVGARTEDVGRLLGYEIGKANAEYAGPTLATSLDATVAAPGMPITFQRQFMDPISGRYQPGMLGLGWTTNWDISLATDSSGNITVHDQGFERDFAKQPDGSFQSQTNDHGTLTALTGGGYQLREVDGSLEVFNADGTLGYEQDANGNRITVAYTGGLLTSLTHSSGAFIKLSYSTQGLLTGLQTSDGHQATYGYDSTGQHLVSYTDEYGTTNYSYLTGQTNPALQNALATIAYSDNTHIFFSYDTQGRLVRTNRDNGQEAVTYAYPGAGGLTTTNANGATSTVLMDDNGLAGETVDPLGNAVFYTRDSQFEVIQALGPMGEKWTYTHDTLGDTTSSTNPLGETVHYAYSGMGQLTSFQDARGNTTQYNRDGSGNLLAIQYPNGSLQQLSYDPTGTLSELVNARGDAIKYTNNAAGQVTRIDFADGTHQDFMYSSTTGNMLTATDANGTITLEYGDATNPDLVTKIAYADGKFLAFQYNSVGQRTQSVDQSGFTINYSRDALGRLEKLTDGSGNPIVAYSYDPAGLLARKDLGNGTATTYQYDLAGNILKLVNLAADGTTVNSEFDYVYNALALVTSEQTSDGAWAYSYDPDGQLTHADFTSTNPALPNQDLQYFYDAAGNRTRTIINGVTTAYTANNMNEYTQVGSTAYTFDADGNLISATSGGTTTSNTFNDLNQLTGVGGPGLSATYGYDPLGSRDSQTVNGVTTNFLIDPAGLGDVASEYTGSGTLIAHHTDGLGLTSRVDASGAAAYYDFDANGNTAGLTGQTGGYVNRYAYLPFGETTTLAAALPNAFTFVGQFGVKSDESGMFNMRARDYDPVMGSFISNDPLNLGGGDTNLRRYAANDPVIISDPSGLCWYKDFLYRERNRLRQQQDQFDVDNPQERDLYKAYQKEIDMVSGDIAAFEHQEKGIPEVEQVVVRARKSGPGDPPGQSGGAGRGANTSCDVPPKNPNAKGKQPASAHTDEVGSFDPNELIGPAGFGANNWVTPAEPLVYTTEFENDPKHATAPALEVIVTEQLDANLDWTTLQFDSIQFGANVVNVPAGLQSYQTTINTTNTDGTPLEVQISAQLNQQTGQLTWTFNSIDPATGLPPADPLDGFLPVDDSTGRGQGFVTYTIKPKPSDATGTALAAQATVVFDTNSPLNTNAVTNIIDAGPPTSSVAALPAAEISTSFIVSWSGTDDVGGSGIANYDVFVSDNGGPFTAFQTATTATSATFTGQNGHAYGFYSLATDNLGHRQATPTAAQATTLLDTVLPTSSVAALPATETSTSFTVSWSGSDAGGPGIASYDVYTSDNGGPFTAFQMATTQTSATFTGVNGHTYGFYSVATDTAGNRQATPTAAQATTTVSVVAVLPTSSVAPLPAFSEATFTVSWSGSDAGGPGIAKYDVFVSDNGGAFTAWQTGTTNTSAAYQGTFGHTYGFYSVAVDSAGNRQPTPTAAQATTEALVKDANGQFVLAVYHDVLDRLADADGLAFWTQLLDTGTAVSSVAQSIAHSDEYYANFVIKPDYLSLLDRAADADGVKNWTTQMDAGLTDQQLEAGFVASDEFFNNAGGTTTAWIDAIYKLLLGRAADAGGEQYWNAQLSAGATRDDVALRIANSAENDTQLINDDYFHYLGRAADPDGLAFWLQQFADDKTNEDVISGFTGSAEYYKQHTG